MTSYLVTACQESFANFTTAVAESSSNRKNGYNYLCASETVHQFNATCAALGPTYNFTAGVLFLDSFCRNETMAIGGSVLSNETQGNRCSQGFLTLAQTISVTSTSSLCQTLPESLNSFNASCGPFLDLSSGGSAFDQSCHPTLDFWQTKTGLYLFLFGGIALVVFGLSCCFGCCCAC
ncbi:hypothetical protein BDR26DRAFT_853944 [Obelidium mucronatum]|nr:hypothetical protein BDR26DRAFT_853944 [Obelidium mucronatum]